MIEILVTIAVAIFAISAFLAIEGERQDRLDKDGDNWLRSERLYRKAHDIVMRDRKEAQR